MKEVIDVQMQLYEEEILGKNGGDSKKKSEESQKHYNSLKDKKYYDKKHKKEKNKQRSESREKNHRDFHRDKYRRDYKDDSPSRRESHLKHKRHESTREKKSQSRKFY